MFSKFPGKVHPSKLSAKGPISTHSIRATCCKTSCGVETFPAAVSGWACQRNSCKARSGRESSKQPQCWGEHLLFDRKVAEKSKRVNSWAVLHGFFFSLWCVSCDFLPIVRALLVTCSGIFGVSHVLKKGSSKTYPATLPQTSTVILTYSNRKKTRLYSVREIILKYFELPSFVWKQPMPMPNFAGSQLRIMFPIKLAIWSPPLHTHNQLVPSCIAMANFRQSRRLARDYWGESGPAAEAPVTRSSA